jgi:hypothetical protein
MEAEQASSFFVKIALNAAFIQKVTLHNMKTKETLVINGADWDFSVVIARYPMNAKAEWIEGMAKQCWEWNMNTQYGNISL